MTKLFLGPIWSTLERKINELYLASSLEAKMTDGVLLKQGYSESKVR